MTISNFEVLWIENISIILFIVWLYWKMRKLEKKSLGAKRKMSNEESVRLVLDQLAKDYGFGSWELFKTFSIKTSPLVWKATQRAAELGFVAGQKQKEEEVVVLKETIAKMMRGQTPANIFRCTMEEKDKKETLEEHDKNCKFCQAWKAVIEAEKVATKVKNVNPRKTIEKRLFSEGGKGNEL